MPRFQKDFTLCTDASSIGLGAVLEQEGHAVAYFSRALRGAESRCSSPEYTPTGIYPGIIWARTEYT